MHFPSRFPRTILISFNGRVITLFWPIVFSRHLITIPVSELQKYINRPVLGLLKTLLPGYSLNTTTGTIASILFATSQEKRFHCSINATYK